MLSRQPEDGGREAQVAARAKTDAEWQQILSPEQYRILRRHGTEPAFSSPLERADDRGTYHCAGCKSPLFSSTAKYHSGSGWPSFYQCFDHAVATAMDFRLILPRTEVHCACCNGHLGHLFKDGPEPTGLRYCVNGVSLTFVTGE